MIMLILTNDQDMYSKKGSLNNILYIGFFAAQLEKKALKLCMRRG